MSARARMVLAAAGAVGAEAALAALRAVPPGGARRWDRVNYRGRTVTLLAGPALATAATITAATGAGPRWPAALVAGAGSGLVGVYDDLAAPAPGRLPDKGFAGHLRALRHGRVSSGLVKLGVVGAAGLVAGRSIGRPGPDRLVAGAVVAGTANLVNLLDLRPGRALKAVLLAGAPLLRGPLGGLIAGPVGAAGALLRYDLGEQSMLGDGGANALGALLGLRLAAGGGPPRRRAVLAVLVALTVLSERVSFSRLIDATPGLRHLDALGRRPGPG